MARAKQAVSAERRIVSFGLLLLLLMLQPPVTAEDDSYPLQREIADLLRGDPKQAEHQAKLMPLRFLLSRKGWVDEYKRRVLDELSRSNPQEALPLLEPSLAWDGGAGSFWAYGEWRRAAELWIEFRTKGMSDEDKARFLASTLMPGFPLYVCSETKEALAGIPKAGREALLQAVQKLDGRGLETPRDIVQAAALADAFTKDGFQPSDDEVQALLLMKSDYVSYVCLAYLGDRGDRRVLESARKLVLLLSRNGTAPDVSQSIAGGLARNLRAVDGGSDIIVEILRHYRNRLPAKDAWQTLDQVLAGLPLGRKEVLLGLKGELEALSRIPPAEALGVDPALSVKEGVARILRRLELK